MELINKIFIFYTNLFGLFNGILMMIAILFWFLSLIVCILCWLKELEMKLDKYRVVNE